MTVIYEIPCEHGTHMPQSDNTDTKIRCFFAYFHSTDAS
ncbi:hypothetical protein ATCC53582_00388 [Novacetimonas hansenii]|nr:hypothetical protein ATCC53582_00388 [Novacetimonas hansenii]